MASVVVLPKMGMTMVEGTITEWFVQDGDSVALNDQLFAFETEKVDYEVEAEAAGIVRVLHPVDATLPAGEVVAYILAEGEDLPADAIAPAPAAPPPAAAAAAAPLTPTAAPALPRATGDGAVKASPAAKRLAQERGIDLRLLQGTGPGGRIVKEDVEAATTAGVGAAGVGAAGVGAASAAAPSAGPVKASPVAKRLAAEHNVDLGRIAGSGPDGRIIKEDVEAAIAAGAAVAAPAAPAAAPAAAAAPLTGELPYRGIRRTIGQRMFESLQSMAQLTMSMDVDMTEAVKLRRDLLDAWEADGLRVTYTDMVTKAVALALRDHPRLNAALDGDTIRVQPDVHVGFAVALDDGLIVPVIRHADRKPLKEIAGESAVLAGKAREGGLTPDDLTGGTFTVTSLGMFDIDVFTPIINPPQAAILGVGRIREHPAFVGESGTQLERRSSLTISLTIDHRVVDGAPGAQFMQGVRRYLQHPYLLLTDV